MWLHDVNFDAFDSLIDGVGPEDYVPILLIHSIKVGPLVAVTEFRLGSPVVPRLFIPGRARR